jgi:hypothetical protein
MRVLTRRRISGCDLRRKLNSHLPERDVVDVDRDDYAAGVDPAYVVPRWMRWRVGNVMPSTDSKPSKRWAAGAPATISTS